MDTAEITPGLLRRGLHVAHMLWEITEKAMLIGVPLVFGTIAVIMISREVGREPISIAELSVPPALAETGLTPPVAALRLLDAINATARAVRTEDMHRPSTELDGEEPDLNLPAAGISLRSLASLIRSLMGLPERRLRGEIIAVGEELRLRLRLAGSGVIADIAGPASAGADALLARAAPEVWRVVSPRLYAWHIAQSDADEEDIRDRLMLLRRHTDGDAADATIDYLIARSLIRSGQAHQALQIAEGLLADQPGRASGHYARAMALRALGDHARALEAQRRGLALDPRAAWAHLSAAVLLREMGRFDEALAAVREAQRLDDDDRDELTEEAHILRLMGRLADASGAARRALALDPAYAPAHAAVGHTLLLRREEQAALAAFETALLLAPNLADGHTGRGEALVALGRAAEALEALARAAALNRADHRSQLARAELLGRQEQWDEALGAYDQALTRSPLVAALHLGRGTALIRLGRAAEAAQALRRAIELGRDDPTTRTLLAEAEGR